MRRLTVLNLLLQIVFPAERNHCLKLRGACVGGAPYRDPLYRQRYRTRFLVLVSGSGTVVEHLPHHPKFKGSNPGTVTGTWKDENAKKMK